MFTKSASVCRHLQVLLSVSCYAIAFFVPRLPRWNWCSRVLPPSLLRVYTCHAHPSLFLVSVCCASVLFVVANDLSCILPLHLPALCLFLSLCRTCSCTLIDVHDTHRTCFVSWCAYFPYLSFAPPRPPPSPPPSFLVCICWHRAHYSYPFSPFISIISVASQSCSITSKAHTSFIFFSLPSYGYDNQGLLD
jgi:hypothetical protein